jgi:hypothetical protein
MAYYKNGRLKDPSKKVLNGKFHDTRPVAKPRTRWEDVVRRDTSQILGMRGWNRRAEVRTRLLRDARAQKGLQRHRWQGNGILSTNFNVFNNPPTFLSICFNDIQ